MRSKRDIADILNDFPYVAQRGNAPLRIIAELPERGINVVYRGQSACNVTSTLQS